MDMNTLTVDGSTDTDVITYTIITTPSSEQESTLTTITTGPGTFYYSDASSLTATELPPLLPSPSDSSTLSLSLPLPSSAAHATPYTTSTFITSPLDSHLTTSVSEFFSSILLPTSPSHTTLAPSPTLPPPSSRPSKSTIIGLTIGLSLTLLLLPPAIYFIYRFWRQKRVRLRENAVLADMLHQEGFGARIAVLRGELEERNGKDGKDGKEEGRDQDQKEELEEAGIGDRDGGEKEDESWGGEWSIGGKENECDRSSVYSDEGMV